MSGRMPITAASVILNTLGLWLAMAVAAIAWWPIYQDLRFVSVIAITTLLGSAIAIAGALTRASSAVLVPVTLGVFTVSGVALAVPDKALYGLLPTLEGLVDLFSGVALGWKQLLTITLPVGSYQSLLVPVVVLTLVGVVAALSLALRSTRGGIAVAIPVLHGVVGLAFGATEAHWPIQLSLALLAISLLWLMWRRWYLRRSAIRRLTSAAPGHRILGLRTIASAVVVMALAGAVAMAAAAVVPPVQEREVLRSHIEQPFDPRDYPSPLAGFRQYLRDVVADEVLFTVRGLPEGEPIRVAALDSYDGIVYAVGGPATSSESGSFTRVPYVYDQSLVDGEEVSIEVSLGSYSGVWLPTIGKFESIAFRGARANELRDAFYYNDTAATAAVIGGLDPGDSYRLEAVLPTQPSTQQISDLTPGSASVPPLSVPAELATVLERYTRGIDGPGDKLVAMIAGLRAEGYVSHGIGEDEPPSRSGHSADRITQLLTDQRMIGDSEQYAVAAALMARVLGFPARVVFGFAPETSTGDEVEVTGEMVSAWIEVNTAQFGWVTIDPNPVPREIPEEEPEDPSEVSRPQPVIPPQEEEQDVLDVQTPIESSQDAQPEVDGLILVLLAVARVLGWVLLVVAVLLSPFIVVLGAKLRRRRLRRRAASPLLRISGGWKEFEDAVVDHGISPPPSATRTELAAVVGGSQPMAVAIVADRAIFAPIEPDEEDAARLWAAIEELTDSLALGKSRWQRLRARISLRSLGGHSVSTMLSHRRSSR